MKFKKLCMLIVGLLFILANTLPVKAQEKKPEPETKIQKYEVAIDFQGFSYPEKVFFKINNIKDGKIKGAYRFGISNMKYHIDKIKRAENTTGDKDYKLIQDEKITKIYGSFGYERQYAYNNVVFYYGADIGGGITVYNEKESVPIQNSFGIQLTPFVGIKTFLSKNLSIAFEAGVENTVIYDYPVDNGQSSLTKRFNYFVGLDLPYSLTFNFNF